MDEIELLRDAIAVQEERDRAAALRVGEPPMGCDTSDHLADIILNMRNPWISVDDRLPDHSESVLVYGYEDEQPDLDRYEFYAIGCWMAHSQEWLLEGRYALSHHMADVEHITHWCELPKPPGA